jgi:ABC-2 type transport system ATP-binding protein
LDDLPRELQIVAEAAADGATVVRSNTPLVHLRSLADWALGRGFDLADIDVRRPTLEEVYLALTNTAGVEQR